MPRMPRMPAAMFDDDDDDDDVMDARAVLGVTEAHRQLVPWLRKIVDSGEDEQPLEIILVQVTSLAGEKTVAGPFVHDFERPVEELIQEVLQAAQDDIMNGHIGKVQYAIRIEGQKKRRTFILEVPIRRGTSDGFHRNHFPDMEGIAAQQMEHTQLFAEKIIEVTGRNDGLLMTLLERKEQEIIALKRNEFEYRRQIEKLASKNLERDMMIEDFKRDQERKDKFADGFKQIGPPIIAGLMGPQVGAAFAAMSNAAGVGALAAVPGSGVPTDEDLIDELVLAIEKGDKVQRIIQILDPEDLALFAEIHKRSASRREARAQAQAAEAAQAKAAQQEQNGQNGPSPNGPSPGSYGYPSTLNNSGGPSGYDPSNGMFNGQGGFRPHT